jgi:protein TonB
VPIVRMPAAAEPPPPPTLATPRLRVRPVDLPLSASAAPLQAPERLDRDALPLQTIVSRIPTSLSDDEAMGRSAEDVVEPMASPMAPVRVGGDVKRPAKIAHVDPAYPSLARQARVSGLVIIEAIIAKDGTVRDARVLRSVRLLDQAALDAVNQWRFTPTLLNGEPVEVVMSVNVTFALE